MEGAELNRFTFATSESSKDGHFLPEQRLAEDIFKLCFCIYQAREQNSNGWLIEIN
ncbi:hypothetical protein MTR_1g019285 [Medicago truncatula]|uniref:Uncharacterized protein n=1 Tax=Medicago truncatula TaxID=3880 RepID=A0A072VF13_MEDTR|nr:hypothetical protein MTR_1g019285 [Medicago truncatula]